MVIKIRGHGRAEAIDKRAVEQLIKAANELEDEINYIESQNKELIEVNEEILAKLINV